MTAILIFIEMFHNTWIMGFIKSTTNYYLNSKGQREPNSEGFFEGGKSVLSHMSITVIRSTIE